jgi:hypothetical protein
MLPALKKNKRRCDLTTLSSEFEPAQKNLSLKVRLNPKS